MRALLLSAILSLETFAFKVRDAHTSSAWRARMKFELTGINFDYINSDNAMTKETNQLFNASNA